MTHVEQTMSPSHPVGSEQVVSIAAKLAARKSPSHAVGLEPSAPLLQEGLNPLSCLHPTQWARNWAYWTWSFSFDDCRHPTQWA